MYVLTWKSEFSLENVNYSGSSKVLQSLCKFHLYFWFKRFQKIPVSPRRHLDPSDYKFLMNSLKLYHSWDSKYEQTGRIWALQVQKLNERYGHGNWDSLRSTGKYQSGYTFRVISGTLPANTEKQFVRIIRPKSDGIISLGQTFFVQSLEAFIYTVLGAQANSRFTIVNRGGRSLQTQEIFHKLVGSTIVQNDNTVMISNYRVAIKDTNVILNQNISPGLLIIPSQLIILKDPIPGYNNSITTSTINRRFGTNQGLNKVKNL